MDDAELGPQGAARAQRRLLILLREQRATHSENARAALKRPVDAAVEERRGSKKQKAEEKINFSRSFLSLSSVGSEKQNQISKLYRVLWPRAAKKIFHLAEADIN